MLSGIGDLVAAGTFRLPVVQTFPLGEVAQAHRVGEAGGARGKLVLTVGGR
jgi:NADPH:quinone reductase-like Zn-dependent oxidoreductase